jgi:hypothetical protein
MTVETVLTKRRARYVGEVGFFSAAEMFDDDVAAFAMDTETLHTIRSERRLQALKYLWALVHLVTNNSNRWLDKNEAMHDLKLRAGYVRLLTDESGKLELRPKSLTRISDEELRVLTAKIQGIICDEILPGVKRDQLRREIEEMVGDHQHVRI